MALIQKLKINSCDRLNVATTTPSDFTIELPNNLHGTYQLHWIYMPLLFENITEHNSRIYFNENGEDKIAYLAVGKYAGATILREKMVEALNTASGGVNTYEVSYDNFTNRLTITASNVDFSFNFSNTFSSSAEVLGFSQIDYSSSNLSLTAPKTFNLSTLQVINIEINEISSISDSNSVIDPTFTMPILYNIGSIQFYTPPVGLPEHFHIANQTKTLNIRVVDDHSRIIPLQAEWHMIIKKVYK